jgi:hypothetical protein
VRATFDEQPQVQTSAIAEAMPRVTRLDRFDRSVRGDEVMAMQELRSNNARDFAVPAEVPAM